MRFATVLAYAGYGMSAAFRQGLSALGLLTFTSTPGRLHWYDTGGIDPVANPGVYSFKKGMNGVELSELCVFKRAPHPLLAHGVAFLETIYRRVRALV